VVCGCVLELWFVIVVLERRRKRKRKEKKEEEEEEEENRKTGKHTAFTTSAFESSYLYNKPLTMMTSGICFVYRLKSF